MKRNKFILSALTAAIAPLAAVDQNKKLCKEPVESLK
jgi:hypothetical protein